MDCGHGYVFPSDCDVCEKRTAAEALVEAMRRPELDASLEAELRECADALKAMVDAQKRRHEWELEARPAGALHTPSVYEMLDPSGRPLLAELVTAQAYVLSALARL